MSDNEAWLATEDPTNGELPATEFIGTPKDLSQTKDAEPNDGSGLDPTPVGTPEDPQTPGGDPGETVQGEVTE